MTPSPDQIAMYGHIAAALRSVMADRGWTPADLSKACGFPKGSTAVYGYLGCRAAPAKAVRQQMCIKLQLGEASLTKRELPKAAPQAHLVRAAERADEPRQQIIRPLNPNPVLTFIVSADGTARIKLDAAMPLSAASPLLRILLDAGLVPSTQGDDNAEA